MPVEGQEDDDFAYEDEHIEMESDNEEYEPLDEGEFDSSSALIRAELKPPVVPSSVPRQPDAKPARREGAPEFESPRALAHNIPTLPKMPAGESRMAEAAGPQAPKVKRATKQPAKPPARTRPQATAKASIASRGTKRDQPVRKNAAKPAKKTLAKKATPPKKSSPAKKKGAPKARKKLIRSRPAPRKKRRA
jgi:hypothetical protein